MKTESETNVWGLPCVGGKPRPRRETGRERSPCWLVSWVGRSLRDCVGTPQICHPKDTQSLEHAAPACRWLCLCEHGGLPQASEKAPRQQGRGTWRCHPVPSGTTPPYPEARREAMRLGTPRPRAPFNSPLDIFPVCVSAVFLPAPTQSLAPRVQGFVSLCSPLCLEVCLGRSRCSINECLNE